MRNRTTFPGCRGLLAVALLAVGCSESVGPERRPGGPAFAPGDPPGIVFDQSNGTLNASGTIVKKGFNSTNPHRGDAIIATFFWVGSSNIVSVTDHLADVPPTQVGNTYTLVEFVTAGGISMATYVATNVQNFPDAYSAPAQDSILVVEANFSSPVPDGGIMLSAYSGVNAVQALDVHHSASGTGSSTTTADPGTIAVGAGALAYGVTMSDGVVGLGQPTGFTPIPRTQMSDNAMKVDGEFAVQAAAGSVDPQWTWFFNAPSTWLATVLALTPAAGSASGNLTVTTSTTGSNLDPNGYTVTVDGGPNQAIATNGSVTFSGLTAGNHSVALSDVAANCKVKGPNPQSVTVPAGGTVTIGFAVTCNPPSGDLTVMTTTTGLSLDLDGYTVTVDWTDSKAIGTNGTVTFTGLSAGDHMVTLSGVAVNCTVSGANPQTVTVPSGGTVNTTFAVNCVPGPATHLVFTVQPSTTAPRSSIKPAVQVTALDAQNNQVTSFTGLVTIAIGRNGGTVFNGTLSGTKTVAPSNGVATFSNLSIDQLGHGYTLVVGASGLTGAESAPFDIAVLCVGPLCL